MKRSIEEVTRALAAAKGYEIKIEQLQKCGASPGGGQRIAVFDRDGTRVASFLTWQYTHAWTRRARKAPGFQASSAA
jgi:hypothetical protein